jgi:hypothetical protein
MPRLSYHLESLYPELVKEGYEITSPKDKQYNCVAWAAESDTGRWWEPSGEPFDHWPDGVPYDYAFENYVSLFEVRGYSKCADASLEEGYEKVAIYKSSDGWFTHVAQQLETGKWTSKLGPDEDVEHLTPHGLESVSNGSVEVILRRERNAKTAS